MNTRTPESPPLMVTVGRPELVRDVMRSPAAVLVTAGAAAGADELVAHPDQPVSELITVMRLAGLCAVSVVRDGRVVGTVTDQDIARGARRPARATTRTYPLVPRS